ncbi:MAG TPA: hypothetical protein ENI27_00130 [bacterium]|nr:hypothetical protein [bacterium]
MKRDERLTMTDSNQYQNRYWKELFELRVHVNYLELYMEDSEFKNNFINIFLAVTSSSSICGWAIWNKYGFIWAVIIAASQFISVAKRFLPYRKRLKTTGSIMRELEELSIFAEMKWFDVAEGKLKEEEINKLQFEIRSKKTKAVKKHLGINTLPTKEKLLDKAKKTAEVYVNNFYGE